MMIGAIVGTLAIVLITVTIGIVVDRKTKLLPKPEELAPPRPPTTHAIGEAPVSAFRAGEAQLSRLRAAQRCPSCRAEMTYAADTDDRVRYDERDLLVLHFRCPKCAAKRTIYVEPTTSTSRPQ